MYEIEHNNGVDLETSRGDDEFVSRSFFFFFSNFFFYSIASALFSSFPEGAESHSIKSTDKQFFLETTNFLATAIPQFIAQIFSTSHSVRPNTKRSTNVTSHTTPFGYTIQTKCVPLRTDLYTNYFSNQLPQL